MGTPLQVTVSFSLAALKILSSSLSLDNVIMICLGVCFLGSKFFGLSEVPGLPGGVFPLPVSGSSPSLFVQISYQFLVLPILLLAPLRFGCWNV